MLFCYVLHNPAPSQRAISVIIRKVNWPCHAVWWSQQALGCRTSHDPLNIPTRGNCWVGCRCCVSEYVHFDLNPELIWSHLCCRPGYIYLTFRNFFFIFLLWAKLSQYLLDRFSRFFFTKWKVFSWIFAIRSSFSDSSRDVAMATNFVAKMWHNYLPTLHLSLCHSETERDIATSVCALTA